VEIESCTTLSHVADRGTFQRNPADGIDRTQTVARANQQRARHSADAPGDQFQDGFVP